MDNQDRTTASVTPQLPIPPTRRSNHLPEARVHLAQARLLLERARRADSEFGRRRSLDRLADVLTHVEHATIGECMTAANLPVCLGQELRRAVADYRQRLRALSADVIGSEQKQLWRAIFEELVRLNAWLDAHEARCRECRSWRRNRS